MALTLSSDTSATRSALPISGLALLVFAVAQIVASQSPEWFGIGRNVAEQSAATSHPLVPLGPAFAIWGLIYLYGLVSAVWALWHRDSAALKTAGGHLALIWLLDAVWSVWVPVNGIDWISFVIIAVSVISGVSGLLKLNEMSLSQAEKGFLFAPMALVTGWITAAMVVNFTSSLVAAEAMVNPRDVIVSLAFLLGLIAVAGGLLSVIRSVVYAVPLVWALGWIAAANVVRQNEPLMAFTAVIGIGLLLVLTAVVKRRA
ncbi:hypothetical protein PQU92_08865 [Asticcacaulis sp. BYS171W]|uniref:Tryptophan-rich sensory protein n=1 Tax=Asticcacaulis aquaticus TaxID=2984212 RepID=A0ABT5HTM0_9CAUL|nr:hypothetical protein [Asticcacaulis aquaticus]MDC7683384.1 hypothetical protein [Asticcacaulis aquaticus]